MILLIDDSEIIRNALAELIEYEGYSVMKASDGNDALNILENPLLPSLIFLDLMMLSGLNGWQFREIQSNNPRIRDIPTVICSAKINFGKTFKLLPNESLLPKPFDINRLFEIIRKYYKS